MYCAQCAFDRVAASVPVYISPDVCQLSAETQSTFARPRGALHSRADRSRASAPRAARCGAAATAAYRGVLHAAVSVDKSRRLRRAEEYSRV